MAQKQNFPKKTSTTTTTITPAAPTTRQLPSAKIKAKAGAKKKSFALAQPFADPAWPVMTAEEEQVIMELLYR